MYAIQQHAQSNDCTLSHFAMISANLQTLSACSAYIVPAHTFDRKATLTLLLPSHFCFLEDTCKRMHINLVFSTL